MPKREEMDLRDFEVRDLQVRADDDGTPTTLTGYAVVFNQRANIGGYFEEEFLPGAFEAYLGDDRNDIYAVWNHDLSEVIGRRKNNTLSLREDGHGLWFEITPPNTVMGRTALTLVDEGFVDKMSFRFLVDEETRIEREDEVPLYQIRKARLREVSPVPFPAYEGTELSARCRSLVAAEQDAAAEAARESEGNDGGEAPDSDTALPVRNQILRAQIEKEA